MSQIQSSVGLITGIPIQDTVDQLMALAGTPRDTLQSRTNQLSSERSAVDQVASLLLGFRFAASKLQSESIYSAAQAVSSDESLLTVVASDDPPPRAGSYSFTPLQTASAHQVISSSITDVSSQLASGSIRIGIGGHVDSGVKLNQLNAGEGVTSGSIRINDRSGAFAEIDLRTATTIDDVLAAINSTGSIDVTATVEGDSIKLTDNSGGTGNLRVREVGLGTTAADLGLAGINIAADEVSGGDLLSLHSGTQLASLNDGSGVRLRSGIVDLVVDLADETELSIDLGDVTTLGGVVDAINAVDGTKLTAAISADGNRLELTDLTSGAGTFAVSNFGTDSTADQLGLTQASAGGVITGDRLISGLGDTLINSLNGGQGLALTSVDIVDRAGGADSVDLSSAETLSEVVDIINGSSANVVASINSARNGIVITDESGGIGNLTISSLDDTAADLGIAVDDTVASVNGGSLNRQSVGESTLLSSLNGGEGVDIGDFKITDSTGTVHAVDLNPSTGDAETIGDVIDAINAAGGGDVTARINDSGDGIVVTDTTTGTGTLTITEVSGGTTAKDLRLLGASSATNESDQQVIDGRTSLEIDLSTIEASDSVALSTLNNGNGITLGVFEITDSSGESAYVDLGQAGNEAFTVQDVVDKINTAATTFDVGVTAAINDAGTGIELTDTADGDDTLTVRDVGDSGTTASELLIAGEATTTNDVQSIDGGGLFAAQDADQNRLDAVAQAINDFDGGFVASVLDDGDGFRLSITSSTAGAAQELLVDTSLAGFSINEVSRPQDAVLQIGSSPTGGIIVRSSDNSFDNVVEGLEIDVEAASSLPVTIEVSADQTGVTNAAEDFVESFNSLRSTLEQLTSFDAETATTGLLFGRSEVLRVETDLSRILTSVFSGSASLRSFENLGISFEDDGTLSLNKTKLTSAFESSPQDVERFFTADETGAIERLVEVIDRLAGEENSTLARRSEALTNTIESNNLRIDSMTEQLDRERDRTLLEFFRLEETISQMQLNLNALENIQAIQPLSVSRS